MSNLKLFQFLNLINPQLYDPYMQVAHALTYLVGAATDKWKKSKLEWIMGQPIPRPSHRNVWSQFEQEFLWDWINVNEESKAQEKLMALKQTGDQIDAYINDFTEYAMKAKYDLENIALWEQFKKGLQWKVKELLNYHENPRSWEELCVAARK